MGDLGCGDLGSGLRFKALRFVSVWGSGVRF